MTAFRAIANKYAKVVSRGDIVDENPSEELPSGTSFVLIVNYLQ